MPFLEELGPTGSLFRVAFLDYSEGRVDNFSNRQLEGRRPSCFLEQYAARSPPKLRCRLVVPSRFRGLRIIEHGGEDVGTDLRADRIVLGFVDTSAVGDYRVSIAIGN